MSSLLGLLGRHDWQAMKWGGARPAPMLDCRQCRRCPRFEVWGYWSFHRANRDLFEPVVPA